MSVVAVVLIALILAAPASAQQVPSAPAGTAGTVNVDRLPIDVGKIHNELKRQADVEERQGLNLRYSLHVYGVAPRLVFFSPDENLATGPVPWGAPTHQEIINHITPQEYRAPPADFSNFLRWLADRNRKK